MVAVRIDFTLRQTQRANRYNGGRSSGKKRDLTEKENDEKQVQKERSDTGYLTCQHNSVIFLDYIVIVACYEERRRERLTRV